MSVTRSRRKRTLQVLADDTATISRAGSALLFELADRLGLTDGLCKAMAPTRERRSAQDPGRVVRDLALMLADGGDCLSDLGALRDQVDLFGAVASDSTAWRVIDAIDPERLGGIRAARASARERAWAHGARPAEIVLDIEVAHIGAVRVSNGRLKRMGAGVWISRKAITRYADAGVGRCREPRRCGHASCIHAKLGGSMRFARSMSVLFSLALLSFGVAACGGDGGSAESTAGEPAAAAAENVVNVQLGEDGATYFVKVDKDTVQAGKTTFVIDNVGTMHHEMAIYKTDIAPDKLPLTAEGTVDEEKAGLVAEAVYTRPLRGDEDHRIRDGRGVDYTVDLPPGKYVLLCNLPGHYKAGQFVAFTVEGDATGTAAVTPEEPEAGAQAAGAVKGTAVGVQLGENGSRYFVELDKGTVNAGTTTFVIDNIGTMHHELAIYKTDTAPGKLPLTAEGKVDEEKAGLLAEAVYATPVRGDEDHRIRDGRGANFTIDLPPGKYVLLCNLAGHYTAGQFIAFRVT